MGYMDHIAGIAENDVAVLRKKDVEYAGSWLKRGGVGAYMMLARKIDRIEQQVQGVPQYDVISHAVTDKREEGLLDDIGDLRRYLLLVEAEIRERLGYVKPLVPRHIDTTGQAYPFGFDAIAEG